MPLGDIAGEALGGIARVVGRILVEVCFEILIRGAGDVLVRIVKPKAQPDDAVCTVVGLLFWLVVGIGSYFVYRATTS